MRWATALQSSIEHLSFLTMVAVVWGVVLWWEVEIGRLWSRVWSVAEEGVVECLVSGGVSIERRKRKKKRFGSGRQAKQRKARQDYKEQIEHARWR